MKNVENGESHLEGSNTAHDVTARSFQLTKMLEVERMAEFIMMLQ